MTTASAAPAATQVVCQRCDGIVRIPTARMRDQPKCPRCHEALFQGHPVTLTAGNFDRHVAQSGVPVVVDFWAPWCGPCRSMAPAFAEAARQLEPRVRLAKLNTESEPALAGRFGIRSIPTLILFEHGREIARQSGALDTARLIRWIETRR